MRDFQHIQMDHLKSYNSVFELWIMFFFFFDFFFLQMHKLRISLLINARFSILMRKLRAARP